MKEYQIKQNKRLKIPAAWRQTSWLFTKRGRGDELKANLIHLAMHVALRERTQPQRRRQRERQKNYFHEHHGMCIPLLGIFPK